ncbi:hypothetical protein AVEN_243074-1 [Araneus ventricosus]|uniref:Uncharacterized protein n=1 Tax=Araneus ventricosus TaxID=182803 RepID=A0A4Y2U9W6_ARAVE|nr:hypothetical protein AVEN_243074-1 [Araneus ventricosus]
MLNLFRKKEGGSVSATTSEGKITVTQWVTKNIVVSSFAGVQPMDKAKHFSHATKSLVEIASPNSVRIYNLHIGGVDLMDFLLALYRHSQRNKQ